MKDARAPSGAPRAPFRVTQWRVQEQFSFLFLAAYPRLRLRSEVQQSSLLSGSLLDSPSSQTLICHVADCYGNVTWFDMDEGSAKLGLNELVSNEQPVGQNSEQSKER